MSRIWVTSDLHFGHRRMCGIESDGSKLRPFDIVQQMDDHLVQMFNQRVALGDKCYILGDVTLNRSGLSTISRLHCKDLVLIKGNHDVFRLQEYVPYFRDIRAYHVVDRIVMAHIPIHGASLARWKGQIHGHLHHDRVLLDDGQIDPRYYNVCVENHDYGPILLDEAIANLRQQQED